MDYSAPKENVTSHFKYVTRDQRADRSIQQQNLRIFETKTVAIVKPSGTVTQTLRIKHNLGYEPVLLFYTRDQTNNEWYMGPYNTIVAETYYLSVTASVTKYDLIIDVTMYDPSGVATSPDRTQDVKYYLLRERAR